MALSTLAAEFASKGSTAAGPALLPTADLRSLMDAAGNYLCAEDATRAGVNLQGLPAAVAHAAFQRTAGPFAKPAFEALTATRPDGRPVLAEMLHLVSVVACFGDTFEDMNRLTNVLRATAGTASTVGFLPPKNLNAATLDLARLLGHYQPARQERLAISLIEWLCGTAWWRWVAVLDSSAMCTLGTYVEEPEVPAHSTVDVYDALNIVAQARLEARDLSGDDLPHADLCGMIAAGSFPWADQFRVLLEAIRIPPQWVAPMRWAATRPVSSPTDALIYAHLADLPANFRPQSPLTAAIEAVKGTVRDAEGETLAERAANALPAKPRCFEELLPDIRQYLYSVPEGFIDALHVQTLEVADQRCRFRVLLDEMSNRAHAETAGNCTFSLHHSAALTGSEILVAVDLLDCDNLLVTASFEKLPDSGRRGPGGLSPRCHLGNRLVDLFGPPGAWVLTEIECAGGRAAQHHVTPELVAGIEAVVMQRVNRLDDTSWGYL